MAQNIFGSSSRKLTLLYSIVMIIFLVVLIFAMHKTMEWSITSEQARELMDTASNVAEAQEYFNQHPEIVLDDTIAYKSTNDRLFFYVFDNEGRLLNFARASFRIEPFILDTIAQEKVEPGGVTVFSKPGSENTRKARIMLTAQQVRDDEGNATQTVYVGKDVTAMYNGMEKATYALAFLGAIALIIATIVGHILSGKAMIPLRQAYEKQRQFAADASHELRTPLSVVMASADLLANDPSIESPFLKQVIEDLKDEVKKMSKLVGDLLTVARSDNNAEKIKFQKFDLSSVMQQVTRNMQMMAEKKNITIAENIPDGISYAGDEQKIKQLILIFVDNAIKYTQENGHIDVALALERNNKVIFSVRDNGIGIAKEDQEKIFGRFYRVDKARSREMGGNGLGLAIAKDIIEVHHGQIYIESALGQGTAFTVELPQQKV